MMNEEEQYDELIEHIVEIDDYISVIIKIPKRLDALKMKALMMKTNKLFNLSEVPIQEGPRGSYKKKIRKKTDYTKFSIEELTEIVKSWITGDHDVRNALSSKLEIDRDTLAKKVSYWKQKFNIDISHLTPSAISSGRPPTKNKTKKSHKGVDGRNPVWSVDEIKILKTNYITKTIQELMVLLPGRSNTSIYNRASREGVSDSSKYTGVGRGRPSVKKAKISKSYVNKPLRKSKNKAIIWTKEKNKEFKLLFEGGKTQDEVAEHFNMSLKQVWDKRFKMKQTGEIQDE